MAKKGECVVSGGLSYRYLVPVALDVASKLSAAANTISTLAQLGVLKSFLNVENGYIPFFVAECVLCAIKRCLQAFLYHCSRCTTSTWLDVDSSF